MNARLIVLPILALSGFVLTGVAVAKFNAPPKTGPMPISPAVIPFPDRVAGVGVVEPASETILIGTQIGGIVASVLVKEGDRVTKGQPLLEIDARDAEALACGSVAATLHAQEFYHMFRAPILKHLASLRRQLQ